jgi:hypothetical protein
MSGKSIIQLDSVVRLIAACDPRCAQQQMAVPREEPPSQFFQPLVLSFPFRTTVCPALSVRGFWNNQASSSTFSSITGGLTEAGAPFDWLGEGRLAVSSSWAPHPAAC